MSAQVRKAKGKRHGPFLYFACPWCAMEQAVNQAMLWCARCGVEYSIRGTTITSDRRKQTDRYAFAKAICLAGGIRLRGEEGDQ